MASEAAVDRPGWHRLATTSALATLLVLLAAVIARTAWVGDDAYITFRTVDNFLNGYGMRWNIAERVQSYTHPLWFLLLTPVVAVVGNPFVAALVLSAVVSAIAIGLVLAPVWRRYSSWRRSGVHWWLSE